MDLTEKAPGRPENKKDWNNYFFLVEQQLDDEELMKVLSGLEIMLRPCASGRKRKHLLISGAAPGSGKKKKAHEEAYGTRRK